MPALGVAWQDVVYYLSCQRQLGVLEILMTHAVFNLTMLSQIHFAALHGLNTYCRYGIAGCGWQNATGARQ